jgi:site-specific recombinase XerC
MTDEAMSPLRRRMIEDMTIRTLSPKTQQGYIRTIKNSAAFLCRSPDKASFEDVRRFQLHVAQSGVGTGALNATVAALRFFFRVTLKRSAIRLVNKSPLNAGSAHPIKPANLLDRVRKMRSTNLARTPPATKSP